MEEPDRSTPQLSSLFQQLILEHYKKPRNRGDIPDADIVVHMRNPSCGDEVQLMLKMDETDRVADVKFQGHGCSISQASISMMTGMLAGKTREEALVLAERFTAMMHGDAAAAKDRSLGDLRALAGVSKFPVRVKCALLGFNAMEEGLRRPSEK